MRVSFAIITDGSQEARINEIIDTIEALNIPEYEVLVCGGRSSILPLTRANTRHLAHDEDSGTAEHQRRTWWITGKKNSATREARFEHVVYFHDYHVFDPDWYTELLAFGPDFDICMHRVLTLYGHRMFDWCTFDHPSAPPHSYVPYERLDCLPFQYIPGGYWIGKRQFMLDNPLNETLFSGQEEDVEWSKRIRTWANIRMNPRCVVRHNKVHRECGRSEQFEKVGFPWTL
jgi:hypothetical protein